MYINKFQDGGQADPMQQILQLVQAAMSGDQQAQLQIEQIMQAAQQGDQQAQQIAQAINQIALQMQGGQQGDQQAQMAKRGAKLKKLCGGRKLANGDKVPKAKSGCPCMLKRQGGRLIEIDSCTGQRVR